VISAFDLDGTLLRVNSSYAFAKFLRKHSQISRITFAQILYHSIKHHFNFLSMEDLHLLAFNLLFLGKSEAYINIWVKRFLADHLDEMLDPTITALLKDAQESGQLTGIFSSSPNFLVEPIAEHFLVDRILATQYKVDKDGKFCKIDSIVLGKNKADYLRVICREIGCARSGVTAYSDSHHDIEFLMASGNPVGVKPNTKLRSHCKKNGWMIL
jgi:HAD superfamily hydrolase (TIGR01490 family)